MLAAAARRPWPRVRWAGRSDGTFARDASAVAEITGTAGTPYSFVLTSDGALTPLNADAGAVAVPTEAAGDFLLAVVSGVANSGEATSALQLSIEGGQSAGVTVLPGHVR